MRGAMSGQFDEDSIRTDEEGEAVLRDLDAVAAGRAPTNSQLPGPAAVQPHGTPPTRAVAGGLAELTDSAGPPLKRRRLTRKQAGKAFDDDQPSVAEELGLPRENPDAKTMVYLVTFSHPRNHGLGLVAPETLARRDVLAKMLDAFAHPVYASAASAARGTPYQVERMCLGREPHKIRGADGKFHMHDHVAVCLGESSRYMPVKRALMERHKLASHWSTHKGYHTAVRYIAVTSPDKPASALDDSPEADRVWAKDGKHPRLADAAREPSTAAALQARRQRAENAAAEEGKGEPRASELDIYPIIVENGFRNCPDDNHAEKKLISHLRQHASPQVFAWAFKNRHKLSALIDDVWSWEEVDEALLRVGGSRTDRLRAASQEPCVCNGEWPYWAGLALQLNGVDASNFWRAVYMALADGRREDKRVMTLIGKRGGEGKSFLFSPMPAVYGVDQVQFKPEKGGFPLYGIQTKRVSVLDEWRFDETVLSMATQLVWFEGKPFVVSQPQNQGASGHLLYKGTAPIFITTKAKNLNGLVQAAQRAELLNEESEATMLLRRLDMYQFTQRLPIPPGRKVPNCACCFAQTVLRNAGILRR